MYHVLKDSVFKVVIIKYYLVFISQWVRLPIAIILSVRLTIEQNYGQKAKSKISVNLDNLIRVNI